METTPSTKTENSLKKRKYRIFPKGLGSRPKYIIPLLLLPFILLFYYIFHNWSGKTQPEQINKDSVALNQLNPNMPGVSPEVTDAQIKDKFGAYLEAYKHDKDASALDNIDNNTMATDDKFVSSYTAQDLKRLESRNRTDSLMAMFRKNTGSQTQSNIQHTRRPYNSPDHPQNASKSNNASSQELLDGFSFDAGEKKQQINQKESTYNDQMQLFRDQMTLVDSMQQAYTGKSEKSSGDPDTGGNTSGRKMLTNNFDRNRFDPERDSSFRPLKVSRTTGYYSAFNTASASKPSDEIRAIIDQDIKAIAGTRVRIRLLTDIYAGETLIPKDTYLFGVVTGFQTQRINISINQVIENNIPLPIKLDVFDSDGYLGLYVPGATFREFSKEIGTQGTQGLSQLRTSDNSNVTTGLVNQVFQSASTSVSKLIQKEKAFLKYNYIVYLRSRN